MERPDELERKRTFRPYMKAIEYGKILKGGTDGEIKCGGRRNNEKKLFVLGRKDHGVLLKDLTKVWTW